MNKLIIVMVTVIFLASCNQKKNSKEEGKNEMGIIKDSLTAQLDDLVGQGYINGFGVAIVNQDTTLYAKGFGYVDVEEKAPYTKHTLQNIASVSKTLIGVALLKAREMGKLNLNDPINQYLPFEVFNPNYPEEPITIQHLATHTSTIQDGDLYGQKSYILKNADEYEKAQSMPISGEFNLPDADMDMGDFLKNLLSKEGAWYSKANYLEKKPGELYEYSNVGATLAAYIVELTTQQSYTEFTTQYILEPLGMSSSGWRFEDIDISKHTKLYALSGDEIPFYSLVTYPDGGLITSINDFSNYLSELINGHSGKGALLTKESYNLLFSELLAADNFNERGAENPFDDEYNSGVFFGHTPAGYIGHTGGDPGVSTFMFFDPKTKTGRLLFVNTDLDPKGAKQFYTIWNILGDYEIKLNTKINN
ncbi:MAG: serine hydrolase domain-containing protein [Saonia sp.]